MDILKKIVILLCGAFVYLFIFLWAGSYINEKLLATYYYLILFSLLVAGFISNFLLNRYLFKICPIRAVIYSTASAFLLFASAFLVLKLGASESTTSF